MEPLRRSRPILRIGELARAAGSRYFVLLSTLVAFLVLLPLTTRRRGPFVPLFFFLLLLGFVHVATRSRRLVRIALVLALLPAVTNGLQLADERWGQLNQLVFASFFALVAGAVLYDVLRGGEVTTDTILGAICVYLMAGLVWALLFSFLDGLPGGALRFPEGSEASLDERVYLSFATLTTVGYGDITPVSPAARTLAILEAVFGQLYLAVLVARLVGLHLGRARREG